MSQNRENEFENLFKRAADNNPVNSSNADWNAVLAGLEEKGNDKKGFFLLNNKYVLFTMLLFIVAICSSLITGLIIWNSSSNKKNNKLENVNKINIQQNNTTEKKIAADVYEKVMLEIKKNQKTAKVTTEIQNTNNSINYQNLKNNNPRKIVNADSKDLVPSSNDSIHNPNKSEISTPPSAEIINANSAKTENRSVVISKNSTDSTEEIKVEKTNLQNSNSQVNSNTETKNSTVKINDNSKYFYAGILYAKDKSSIKLEPNKGTGYSVAFMLGYHFSKNWSIESGLHIEKKELYTTGANFDKSILNATGNIVWIESEAKLLEIPITIKRDLFQKKKHSLFVSLGLSSFIVNKETVEYEEEIGGLFQNEIVVFNNNTSNIFSTFNLSLGYQYKLGKIGNIRIEPYFNIPIGVIGNSKSPIYSKGLFLGWTFDFHNNSLKH
jgi:hypothetical protein